MPFTPAHTIAVLPFIRFRYLSATGLLVGSMAPDFEYFFKMSVDGTHGHTWSGLIYFDIPVTIFLSFLFHLVVKQNLILNLPSFLQRKFIETLEFDFTTAFRQRPLIFILSAVIGSATHIVWDGFTHGTGFFVLYFPSLYKGQYVPFQGVDYPLWYALQYISTYTGMFCVLVYILLMKGTKAIQKPGVQYWLMLIAVTLLVLCARFLVHHRDYNLGNLVVSSVSAICIALILCGFMPFKTAGIPPERTV